MLRFLSITTATEKMSVVLAAFYEDDTPDAAKKRGDSRLPGCRPFAHQECRSDLTAAVTVAAAASGTFGEIEAQGSGPAAAAALIGPTGRAGASTVGFPGLPRRTGLLATPVGRLRTPNRPAVQAEGWGLARLITGLGSIVT